MIFFPYYPLWRLSFPKKFSLEIPIKNFIPSALSLHINLSFKHLHSIHPDETMYNWKIERIYLKWSSITIMLSLVRMNNPTLSFLLFKFVSFKIMRCLAASRASCWATHAFILHALKYLLGTARRNTLHSIHPNET